MLEDDCANTVGSTSRRPSSNTKMVPDSFPHGVEIGPTYAFVPFGASDQSMCTTASFPAIMDGSPISTLVSSSETPVLVVRLLNSRYESVPYRITLSRETTNQARGVAPMSASGLHRADTFGERSVKNSVIVSTLAMASFSTETSWEATKRVAVISRTVAFLSCHGIDSSGWDPEAET